MQWDMRADCSFTKLAALQKVSRLVVASECFEQFRRRGDERNVLVVAKETSPNAGKQHDQPDTSHPNQIATEGDIPCLQ
jgi:hypothetical protein